jgi:flagellar biosynthetic protein FlhB
MAEGEQSSEDRTEAPSQRRLQEARDAGQLPVSRDLGTLAMMAGAAMGASMLAPGLAVRMATQCAAMFDELDRISIADGRLGGHLSQAALSAALLAGSIIAPAMACAIGCTLLQTQFYIGAAPLKFDLSRISPLAGFGRMFSRRRVLDFLKSLLRLTILSIVLWSVLRHTLSASIPVLNSDVGRLLPAAGGQLGALVRPMLMLLVVSAAADVFLVRYQHMQSMKMSRQDLKMEMKQSNGDPFIKARLRRMREQRSRRRMMDKVKTAAVVLTNPTHYAVALAYERGGDSAPRVVAKGADLIAARIREEAAANGVPVVENPPLARALFKVELDQEIPADHYRAVAEVIAFVWKLKNRMSGATVRA